MNFVESARNVLSNPDRFKAFVKKNKKDIIQWGVFTFVVLALWFIISDGDFSFFLTLESAVQCFGFGMISTRVYQQRTVSGLSLQTIICYSTSFIFKLTSILLYEGYLPYDSSGDWLYQLINIISFLLSLVMLYLVGVKHKISYNWDLDNIKCYVLIVPTFILAIIFHPSLNAAPAFDIAWTFSLYLECVAMLPQIYMFTKKDGEIEAYTSHFVASQAIARILGFSFWVFTFEELNDEVRNNNGITITPGHIGYCVFVAQLIQILLMADFLYHYIKSSFYKSPLTLPNYMI